MFVEPVRLDGTEGSETDVKHNGSDRHTLVAKLSEKLLCEVQSRSRGRRRAVFSCVNGLISALVLESLGDVGGQRHKTYLVKHVVNILVFFSVILKFDKTVALFCDLLDLSDKRAVTKDLLHSHASAFSGLNETFPRVKLALT